MTDAGRAVGGRPPLLGRLRPARLGVAPAGLSPAAGQALVVHRLAGRIGEQGAVPAGKAARDFVGTAAGFWLTLVLLALLVAGNLAALPPRRRDRYR